MSKVIPADNADYLKYSDHVKFSCMIPETAVVIPLAPVPINNEVPSITPHVPAPPVIMTKTTPPVISKPESTAAVIAEVLSKGSF